MFSVILVMKLRSNYLEQIDHLKVTRSKLSLQTNSCIAERAERIRRLHTLELYRTKCRKTLGRASSTLAALNDAFRVQWRKSESSAAAANNSCWSRLNDLRRDSTSKLELAKTLIAQNAYLKQELERVTDAKVRLEGEVQRVKSDLDGLKSNTSRLEGEKKGLEKVLESKVENNIGG